MIKATRLLALACFCASALVVNAADENVPMPEAKKEEPAAAPAPEKAAAPAEVKKEEAKPEAAAPTEKKESDKAPGSDIVRMLALYPVNIILDLNDILSIELGTGPEVSAKVLLTHHVQFGGSYGEKYFLAKDYNRQFGGGYSNGWDYSLAMEKRYVEDTFGTVKCYIVEKDVRFSPPSEAPVYKEGARDFWETGVQAGWLINARVSLHPVEIVDFVGAIFFLDLTDDNLR